MSEFIDNYVHSVKRQHYYVDGRVFQQLNSGLIGLGTRFPCCSVKYGLRTPLSMYYRLCEGFLLITFFTIKLMVNKSLELKKLKSEFELKS